MDIRETLAFAKQCAQFAKEANVPFNLNFNLNFPFSLFSASDFSAMITPSINPTSDVGKHSFSAAANESQSHIPRGPRTQILFADAYGHEDIERTHDEAQRIMRYITDHHMGQNRLDCKRTNRLTLLVACFWYRWREKGWVTSIPQGAAIYRFVTEHCQLPCDVIPRAFSGTICSIIRERKKDPEIYANSAAYFAE